MRTHPLCSEIALPEKLGEVWPVFQDGGLYLTDGTNKYIGAFYNQPELIKFSESFNYEASGYGQLLPGPGMPERMVSALHYKNHVYRLLQAVDNQKDEDSLIFSKFESDLLCYRPQWTETFNRFAKFASQIVSDRFEIRLKCLQRDREVPHSDVPIILIAPQGYDRKATVCFTLDKTRIVPENGTWVVTTPFLKHSSPVSHTDTQRACLAATVYDYDLI